MKIEKLPSGTYRTRMMKSGITYTLTYPYKPSEKEAYRDLLNLATMPHSQYDRMTFAEAFTEYVTSKSNVLSPSTIRGYYSMYRNSDDKIKKMLIKDIDKHILQSAINKYSEKHSPKSTRNLSLLYLTILRHFEFGKDISIDLPHKAKIEPYIPTQEDIKKILEYFKGTDYEMVFYLLCMGIRRSEAMALQLEDIDRETNIVTINKAKVLNEKNEWIIKPFTKTESSTRKIGVPKYVVDLIYEKGFVYKNAPNQIYKKLTDAENALGLPHFSVHKLRHSFISYAHSYGIPDADIMKMSGHSEQKTLDRIYRHSMGITSANNIMISKMENLMK